MIVPLYISFLLVSVPEIRKRILFCLVPSEKLSTESATAMFLWIIVNHNIDPDDCILVLQWLKGTWVLNQINCQSSGLFFYGQSRNSIQFLQLNLDTQFFPKFCVFHIRFCSCGSI